MSYQLIQSLVQLNNSRHFSNLETGIFDCIIQQQKVKPWVTKTLDDALHPGFLLEAGSEPNIDSGTGYIHNTRKCNFTVKAFNRNATLGP